MRHLFFFLLIFPSLALAQTCGITIDDYDYVPPWGGWELDDVTVGDGPECAVNSGLDPSRTIGGARFVCVENLGDNDFPSAYTTNIVWPGVAVFALESIPGRWTTDYGVDVNGAPYDLNLNVTHVGPFGRFEIEVWDADNRGEVIVTLWSDGFAVEEGHTAVFEAGTSMVEIPYAKFGVVDLEDIDHIRISVWGEGLDMSVAAFRARGDWERLPEAMPPPDRPGGF